MEQRVIYFVTICVANRERVLANETALSAFKAAISKLENWRILAAMLMPDHLHVIVAPIESRNAKLGNFSGALKRWMRQELNASWKWQPGCFDRLLRSDESLHDKWLYVQENPVRAGLVTHWKDWPYQIASIIRCRPFRGFADARWQAKRLPYNVSLLSRRRPPQKPSILQISCALSYVPR
jgi:REP element-mobilizing transposase RayT